jgi:hypothetical protein
MKAQIGASLAAWLLAALVLIFGQHPDVCWAESLVVGVVGYWLAQRH